MEQIFNKISDQLYSDLKTDENLTLSLQGENSQFVRVNNAKIRQTGLVNNTDLAFDFIYNKRNCQGQITLSGDYETDYKRSVNELNCLRAEIVQFPEDPFVVLPENTGSTHESKSANGLTIDQAVDALLPVMQGVDLVGIWSSGRIFSGSSNSVGQKHWFETDTYSLDFSLVNKDHKMVKGTFAGSDWDQGEYEAYIKDAKQKLELMNKKPVKMKPGKYRTWFESKAVADFLSMFSWQGVSEANIRQGSSAFIKMREEGTKLSPLFSLNEDFRTGLVPRFNERGEIAPELISIIDKGNLANTMVSSRTAKEYKVESNNASNEEVLRAPKMAIGSLADENVLQELGTGLFLSNLHYLNWSDNIGGRITGLTRYACFWVENGEIVGPIETMRFDDTIYNLFGDDLEAIGDNVKINPEIETYEGRQYGNITCPGMLVKSFELTL
ncbi:MAG: TldD/PmbA family protein [Planctomycetia bacterium]|nr:TldD/PmbA family protein [Planctomycetia bacterium]